jgi:kinesin family protein 2/24
MAQLEYVTAIIEKLEAKAEASQKRLKEPKIDSIQQSSEVIQHKAEPNQERKEDNMDAEINAIKKWLKAARTSSPSEGIHMSAAPNEHGDQTKAITLEVVKNIAPKVKPVAGRYCLDHYLEEQQLLEQQLLEQQIKEELQPQQRLLEEQLTEKHFAIMAAARRYTERERKRHAVKEAGRPIRPQRGAKLKETKEVPLRMDAEDRNWELLAMIKKYRNTTEFRPLQESDPVETHQISVCIRKRPLNKEEVARNEVDVISVPRKDEIVVHECKLSLDLTKVLDNRHFRFDYAFDETRCNDFVYKHTAKPLVETIFKGWMATCFAYGQTEIGKTYTTGDDFQGRREDCQKGIYAMAAEDVFKFLRSPTYEFLNLTVSASFFEIYSGEVFDLLAEKAKLQVLDTKQQVQILGLTEKSVDSVDQLLELIRHGNAARISETFPRSHAILQIVLRSPGVKRDYGKLSLVDLAGNETEANRKTSIQDAVIRKSLVVLKECIRASGKKAAHIPFRDSKLTHVLRDSFIGKKSKTCMIATISPSMSSSKYSLNTLRYADRIKEYRPKRAMKSLKETIRPRELIA